jgi:hypothetical protein
MLILSAIIAFNLIRPPATVNVDSAYTDKQVNALCQAGAPILGTSKQGSIFLCNLDIRANKKSKVLPK